MPALAQPANDLCSNATVISSPIYSSGNVNYGTATNDTGVNPSCDSSSNTDARQGVWWVFTAPAAGTVFLSQTGSEDTATSVWTGACGALTQVTCSDPESSNFAATSGTTYYILISNWFSTNSSAAANVALNFTFASAVPIADTCASPAVISALPYTAQMPVSAATNDTNANPSCDSTSNTTGAKQGVWWSYTAGPAGAGLLLSELSSQDVAITAWSGADCSTLTQVLCSDPESNISLSIPANATYWIMVSKWNATSYSANTNIVFTVAAAASACCNLTTGACTLTATSCGAGTASTGGATCSPDPCAGACCRADGTCTAGLISACTNVGIYGGNGSACPPGGPACPASVGRCCNGTTCAVVDATLCTGLFTAAGTCTTNLCTFPCCDILTGTCSVVPTANTCSGVSGATGAACSTITCAAPANDLCANAQVISGSGPFPLTVFGQNTTATDTAVLSPTITPCGPSASSSSSRDVYYSFTPTQTRTYTFTLCNTYTGTLDTTMSIHTACPATNANNLMCNDDGCSGTAGPSAIGGFSMTANTTYIIRIARWSTGSGGKFQLDVTTEAFGACCDTSSVCLAKGLSQCTTPSVFIGDGTSCATSGICNGACCNSATGVCTFTSAGSCTGTHGGIGSACTAVFCPSTTCCNDTTGACTLTGTDACPGGTTPNASATCSPSPCPVTACCDDLTSVCTTTGSVACPSGTTPHVGVTCSPSPCPALPNDDCSGAIALTIDAAPINGALGAATGSAISSCSGTDQDLWYSVHVTTAGTYQVRTVPTGDGTGLAVFPNACPVVANTDIACGAQSTTVLNFTGAANTDYLIRVADFIGDDVAFTVQVVSVVSGACCHNTTGVCTTTTTAVCTGGTYQGDNSSCTPTPCISGACCNATTGACTAASGAVNCPSGTTYQGDGGSCSPNPCPQPPPPANDECPGPSLALATVVSSSTVNATGTTSADCSIQCPDTWWDFTAPFADTFVFSATPSSGARSVIALYPDCAQSTTLACVNGGDTTLPFTTVLSYAMTAGQNVKVRISSYACIAGAYDLVVNSTAPSGACCTGSTCSIALASACTTGYQGDNSACTPTLCTPPGVCCRGATCSTSQTSAAACSSSLLPGTVAGAFFATGSASCNGASSTNPCCFPDYNKVDGITVGDIFDFLNDWFAGYKYALIGGDGAHGTLSVQNIFDYLNAWFAGGC